MQIKAFAKRQVYCNALHLFSKNSSSVGGGKVITGVFVGSLNSLERMLLWVLQYPVSALKQGIEPRAFYWKVLAFNSKHPGAKADMLSWGSWKKRKERMFNEEKKIIMSAHSLLLLWLYYFAACPRWPSSGSQTNAQAPNWLWCSWKCVKNKQASCHTHTHKLSSSAARKMWGMLSALPNCSHDENTKKDLCRHAYLLV